MKTSFDELMVKVGSLHDAVLVGIDMRWAEGTATVGVRTASETRRIVVEKLTRLECPREYPWGRSVCINEVRFGASEPHASFRMELEMQSGDVLVICGSALTVEDVDDDK